MKNLFEPREGDRGKRPVGKKAVVVALVAAAAAAVFKHVKIKITSMMIATVMITAMALIIAMILIQLWWA